MELSSSFPLGSVTIKSTPVPVPPVIQNVPFTESPWFKLTFTVFWLRGETVNAVEELAKTVSNDPVNTKNRIKAQICFFTKVNY